MKRFSFYGIFLAVLAVAVGYLFVYEESAPDGATVSLRSQDFDFVSMAEAELFVDRVRGAELESGLVRAVNEILPWGCSFSVNDIMDLSACSDGKRVSVNVSVVVYSGSL